MWRRKKFIVAVVLATVVVAGGVGGAVLAQNGNEGGSQPQAQHAALLDRVCAIYEENTGVAITPQALQDAFAQAQSERQAEALKNRLEYLVEQDQITDEQADQYLEWWQSRPDVPVKFGFKGHGRLGGWGHPCVPAK
jgi:hypothetical protein